MDRMSREELRKFYGYREHKVVLYANEEGRIEPDDLIWHRKTSWRITPTRTGNRVCHDSDKMYRLPLDEVLADPERWSTDILWLDGLKGGARIGCPPGLPRPPIRAVPEPRSEGLSQPTLGSPPVVRAARRAPYPSPTTRLRLSLLSDLSPLPSPGSRRICGR